MAKRTQRTTLANQDVKPPDPVVEATQPTVVMTQSVAINNALLAQINQATFSGGSVYVEYMDAQPMISHGLIVVDASNPNPANPLQLPAQITDAGRQYLAERMGDQPQAAPPAPAAAPWGSQGASTAPAPAAAQPTAASAPKAARTRSPRVPMAVKAAALVLNTNPGELPPMRRAGFSRSAEENPLDALERGQAYDVFATAEMPKPALMYNALVASANSKWSKGNGTFRTRNVTVVLVDKDGKDLLDAHGNPVTEVRAEQVENRIYERYYQLRTIFADDGSIYCIRIQRTDDPS